LSHEVAAATPLIENVKKRYALFSFIVKPRKLNKNDGERHDDFHVFGVDCCHLYLVIKGIPSTYNKEI